MRDIEDLTTQELEALREKLENRVSIVNRQVRERIDKRAVLFNEIKLLEREIAGYMDVQNALLKVLGRDF